MTPDLAASIVRSIAVSLAAVTAGATITVLRLHYRAWKATPSGSGIVPAHVAVISTAHLIFVVVSAVGIVERTGGDMPLSWRTVAYGTASLLTLVALLLIGRFQRRRVQESRTRTVAVETVTMTVDDDTPNGSSGRDGPSA